MSTVDEYTSIVLLSSVYSLHSAYVHI